ncbi:MAG: FAD synthase [Thermoplasmata archaeon]|uniref:FAD synthase n=1 Tax=Candidatus Sysuiplasma superficiale TaxID=2823368 RepID=A0A8J7YQ63_9ARCH|nr:FAD synthase [Candidatus Sysuiplasma superficiale]MBX8644450.1 FAD synthase [Candidatus Sysuiplasma superficiale]MCL4347098.1 FAD synthase [Candidatus Thermoplasmatota archaeon]
MASGVFDLIHLGHVHYLEEAKKLGDELLVVVATDATVRRMKHEPITPGRMRVELVKALKPVDIAVLGHEDDIYKTVEEQKPDVIALGFDQKFDEAELKRQLETRGMGNIRIVRLSKMTYDSFDLDGTRKIIQRIIDWYSLETRLKKTEKEARES